MNENWKFSDIPYTSPDVEALQTRYDALTRRAREAQSPEELVEIVRQRDALQQHLPHSLIQRVVPADVLAGKKDGSLPQHKAAVHRPGGAVQRQTGVHGGGQGLHPFRLQGQPRHRAQGQQLHRAAQRDIIGAAAGNLLRGGAAGVGRAAERLVPSMAGLFLLLGLVLPLLLKPAIALDKFLLGFFYHNSEKLQATDLARGIMLLLGLVVSVIGAIWWCILLFG